MKRIAFVTRVLSSGGAEMVLRQIVNSCAERGMDCLVLSVWKNERIPEFHPSVQIVELDPAGDGLMGKVKQYGQARKLICDFGAEIVLSMPEDIGIYMIPAMFGTGIPVVVSERNNPWVMPYKKVSRILRSLVYPFADGLIFRLSGRHPFSRSLSRKKESFCRILWS